MDLSIYLSIYLWWERVAMIKQMRQNVNYRKIWRKDDTVLYIS